MEEWIIILFFVIPLFGAFTIPIAFWFSPNSPKLITSILTFILLILSLYALVYQPKSTTYILGGWEPIGNVPIAIYLVRDGLSGFMLVIINLIAFFSAVYAMNYMEEFTGKKYFYVLVCLMIAGMNGVVLAGDMFNLFVFTEIAAKSSYALVAFGVKRDELEASFKYQVLGGMASLIILFGIAMIYWQTQTLNMADISYMLQNTENNIFPVFIQLILITGFGVKAAIIPFHAWLPDAHSSAPSPISAMLSGVLIKTLGVYVIMRLFLNVFQLNESVSIVLIALGGLSMIVGVLLAVGAWDLKRLLAYSSISHIGYIIAGLGIGMTMLARGENHLAATLAFTGSLFHMANHAVFKGLLFLNAGAIEYSANTRDMKQMGGLAKYMPITLSSSFSASMSISGMPPFSGFFSKLIIIVAAVIAGFYLIAGLAVIASIITLAYFAKFQKYAFYNKSAGENSVKEVPYLMRFSMISLAVLCLLMSVLVLPGIRDVFLNPAVNTLMETTEYATRILGR